MSSYKRNNYSIISKINMFDSQNKAYNCIEIIMTVATDKSVSIL
jgi:hypothetical protein